MGGSYKDLVVWQRAVELTRAIYTLTATFPDAERYRLTLLSKIAGISSRLTDAQSG
jgi:hypothetical protein